MSYIVSNGELFIEREYIASWKVIDSISRLASVFGGRVAASGALTFGSIKDARRYIERNGNILWAMPGIAVYEYDSCCDSLIGKVEEE